MFFYFEFRDNSYEELKKCEIILNSDTGKYYLVEIEPPCNDRRLLAMGDSVSELVNWALNSFL